MVTAIDGPVRKEVVSGVPLESPSPRVDKPEWHGLRLFGLGRHPRGFDAGDETRGEL